MSADTGLLFGPTWENAPPVSRRWTVPLPRRARTNANRQLPARDRRRLLAGRRCHLAVMARPPSFQVFSLAALLDRAALAHGLEIEPGVGPLRSEFAFDLGLPSVLQGGHDRGCHVGPHLGVEPGRELEGDLHRMRCVLAVDRARLARLVGDLAGRGPTTEHSATLVLPTGKLGTVFLRDLGLPLAARLGLGLLGGLDRHRMDVAPA